MGPHRSNRNMRKHTCTFRHVRPPNEVSYQSKRGLRYLHEGTLHPRLPEICQMKGLCWAHMSDGIRFQTMKYYSIIIVNISSFSKFQEMRSFLIIIPLTCKLT